MKFNLRISRLNNLYFFSANLTEFHFSCRPHFNQEWLKVTGKLSNREKKALKDLKQIFQKYGFDFKDNKPVYLGRYFYCPNEKNKWRTVKNYLSPLEYNRLYNGLMVLKDRFNKIYHEKLLKKWAVFLKDELTTKRFIELFNSIKSFFRPQKIESILNIHLLISPSLNTASGGANLGTKDITLEVPIFQLEDWQVEQAANVIMHELAHIWFENSEAYQLTKKLILNSSKEKKKFRQNHFLLIKEMIIESIAPFGYPCQLYSKKTNPLFRFLLPNLQEGYQAYKNFLNNLKTDYSKLKLYLSWIIYPLTAYYFSNKKKLDRQFIKTIIKLIENKKLKI